MKYILAWMLASAFLTTSAQDRQLFKTHGKSTLYYTDIHGERGKVYTMGRFYDAGGSGSSFRNIDTVRQQSDGSYQGQHSHIFRENGELYLVSTFDQRRKFLLDTVSSQVMNNDLNNAYHLRQYVDMSVRLNDAFPMNHFTFRGAFYTWEALPTEIREMDHQLFREKTDVRFKEIEDSVTVIQREHVRRTDYILAHLKQMDYTALKDSLSLLPLSAHVDEYYANIVTAVALEQPEYYLRLAEDNPGQREALYFIVTSNKAAADRIQQVKGHDAVKKEYMKERKTNQRFRAYALGIVSLTIIGLTIMLTKLL